MQKRSCSMDGDLVINREIVMWVILNIGNIYQSFPDSSAAKDLPANAGDSGFDLWVGKMPWRMTWQPTSVFFLEDPHGQRSLVGCSPWGHKELYMIL